jgi:hypothetical protein
METGIRTNRGAILRQPLHVFLELLIRPLIAKAPVIP